MIIKTTHGMQIFSTFLIELAIVSGLAAFSALLSLFLDLCFREGNIFDGWLEFWATWWLKIHKPALLNKINKAKPDTVTKSGHTSKRDWMIDSTEWFWFKPLGGCVVCMNVWISFVACALFCNNISVAITGIWLINHLAGALLVVLLSNFLVRFFQEKIV